MVAVRTNLFATLSLRVGTCVLIIDVIKGQRGMMGIYCFFFFTRHKCFVDIECSFGSFVIFMRTCKYYWRYSSHLATLPSLWKNHTLGNPLNESCFEPECSSMFPEWMFKSRITKPSRVSSDVIHRHPRGPNIGPRRRFCPLKSKPSKCPRIQTTRGCL